MQNLVNVPVFAVKAALAAALGWSMVQAFDNPDAVSAAFVAVLCTSPTVFGGFRRARDQLLGSAIGGAAAATAIGAGLPVPVALGSAVGGAIGVTFVLGLGVGHAVAAFTAVYVVLVPRGGPWETLAVRVGAVGLGALAAAAVTVLVSALAYHQVFDRRVRLARAVVGGALVGLANSTALSPRGMVDVFSTLAALHAELHDANRELLWRGRPEHRQLAAWLAHIEALQAVAHWGRALALRRGDAAWTSGDQATLSSAARAVLDLTPVVAVSKDPCGDELLRAAKAVVHTGRSDQGEAPSAANRPM